MALNYDNTATAWHRMLQSASDIYDTIDFNTDDLYNEPAPEPWVSFLIGGIFSLMGFGFWLARVRALGRAMTVQLTFSLKLRIAISAFIDNDSALYTIIKMGAQSFLFLGGLQYDYDITFSVMLGYFGLESCCDSLRILLAYKDASSIDDVVVTSSGLKSQLRNKITQLRPGNVYEDLSRNKFIVFMVFVTQCLLISFVVTDIFDSDTHSCHDGTPNCPIVGTFGSWGLYILGIFMACVFLLGPKTNFGQSEQNPAYWIKLLLVAKTLTKVTWYDPITDTTKSRILSANDWRIWLRFVMTFLINGVGFHILVHALPIQVAGQSSLTGVVFRAVGMMYLVDLDDTPGYTLTLVDKKEEQVEELKKQDDDKPQDAISPENNGLDEGEIAAMTTKIIEDAHAQLNALAESRGVVATNGGGAVGGGAMSTAALVFAGGVSDTNDLEAGGADVMALSFGTGAAQRRNKEESPGNEDLGMEDVGMEDVGMEDDGGVEEDAGGGDE